MQHEEPPPPRKLDRHIPRDLETIVLKAMAKEPGRRYATATAMAEDLRRFLRRPADPGAADQHAWSGPVAGPAQQGDREVFSRPWLWSCSEASSG